MPIIQTFKKIKIIPMKKYFLHNGKDQEGPFDINDLKVKNINADTPVWFEGISEWTTIKEVPELKSLISKPPPFIKKENKSEQKIHITNQTKASNGVGTAGFVLAILALLLFWVPILGMILWGLGLLLSFFGLFKSPRGLSIFGLIISSIGFIVVIAIGMSLSNILNFNEYRKHKNDIEMLNDDMFYEDDDLFESSEGSLQLDTTTDYSNYERFLKYDEDVSYGGDCSIYYAENFILYKYPDNESEIILNLDDKKEIMVYNETNNYYLVKFFHKGMEFDGFINKKSVTSEYGC